MLADHDIEEVSVRFNHPLLRISKSESGKMKNFFKFLKLTGANKDFELLPSKLDSDGSSYSCGTLL